MDKNQNCSLLTVIYQNAEMGLKALEYLRPKVKSANLADDIAILRAEYSDVMRSADRLSKDCGDKPKPANPFAKMGLWANVKMKTLADDSAENLAEMIIVGAFMSVVDLIKAIAKNPLAESDSAELARRQKEVNEGAIKTFTAYIEKSKI